MTKWHQIYTVVQIFPLWDGDKSWAVLGTPELRNMTAAVTGAGLTCSQQPTIVLGETIQSRSGQLPESGQIYLYLNAMALSLHWLQCSLHLHSTHGVPGIQIQIQLLLIVYNQQGQDKVPSEVNTFTGPNLELGFPVLSRDQNSDLLRKKQNWFHHICWVWSPGIVSRAWSEKLGYLTLTALSHWRELWQFTVTPTGSNRTTYY